jgi:hypothetical protein
MVTPKAQPSRTPTEATRQTAPMTAPIGPWSRVTAGAGQPLIRIIPAAIRLTATAPMATPIFPSVSSPNSAARQPLRIIQLPSPASSSPGSFLPGQRLM